MQTERKVSVVVRPYANYGESFESDLARVAEAGFRYVSIGFGESLIFCGDGWESEVRKIRNELEKDHLFCNDTHSPYYDLRISSENTDPEFDRRQERSLLATAMLGAQVCAFHPRTHFICEDITKGEDRERSFEDNVSAFESLVKTAEKAGVTLGIENLPAFPGWPPRFYSCDPDDQLRLIDHFSGRSVCGLWDTGHAHLMETDYRQPESIRKLGSRLRATHIHNNSRQMDEHLPPSCGTVNWEEVIGAFRDIGYDGFLTLEPDCFRNRFASLYLRQLFDCVCELDNMLRG